MLSQIEMPFQYECEKLSARLTSFSGLPLYIDLAIKSGFIDSIQKTLQTRSQGWYDEEVVLTLVLLNLAGGDCINDIERLEKDHGLSTLLKSYFSTGTEEKNRWHIEKQRAFPSNATLHRYLAQFHSPEQEKYRTEGEAFIPKSNVQLEALKRLNTIFTDYAQTISPQKTATLDQDATLTKTYKHNAEYCYKKFKAYQPFNTYWAEQEMILHSEFRDGNVNAGYEQLRLLKEALQCLPAGIEEVFLRSDSAGYQRNLLEYCAEGIDPRFGVIKFAIAAKVDKAFKTAVLELNEDAWKPLQKKDVDGELIATTQEWAEVCFVPNWVSKKKRDPKVKFRYLAIREVLKLKKSTKEDDDEKEHPFQTIKNNHGKEYKLFAIVTNRALEGNALIEWHRERCGKSEHAHSIQKVDLAGGQLPSNKFGVDAAWWQCMIFAFNLNRLMQLTALPEAFKQSRMKAIRFHVLLWPAKVIRHARKIYVRVAKEVYDLYTEVRQKIRQLPFGACVINST